MKPPHTDFTTPPAHSAGGEAAAIVLEGICKGYPGVTALLNVDLEVRVGCVHALVGENGAGKSTIIKTLTGATRPTTGSIEVLGREADIHSPRDARRFGISVVYQELTILPNLTAIENVFLGNEIRRRFGEDRGAAAARFSELAHELGMDIKPYARAGGLSVADQQTLEIMRAMHAHTRILILDEPTASLAVAEREALYDVIRSLKASGVTIILVSHDLEEVLSLSDRVTVMREGRVVRTGDVGVWTKQALVEAMLDGKEIRIKAQKRVVGGVALELRDVRLPGLLDGVDLELRRGEIIGIAGLVGSGRTEFLRCIAGLEPTSTGEMAIDGSAMPWPRSPREAIARGIGLAPEDRKSQGLVMKLSSADNVNLSDLSRVASVGAISRSKSLSRAGHWGSRVGLAERAVPVQVSTLSGGNQQKVILARWAGHGLRVLLADEPTRGIDIGAKADVYRVLDELAANGLSVVVVSSELEELVDNCDRVVALAGGRFVGEFTGADLSVDNLLTHIFIEGRDHGSAS